MAKNHDGDTVPWQSDTRWIDGSVENDIPMKRLSELFNVNNFIVCQVNPHIYPFIALSPKEHLFGGLYEKCFTLFMSEIKYRLQQIHSTGYFRKTSYYLLNIIQQPYQGDVTIVPKLALKDYISMFSDLGEESVNRAIIRGQHATWPKISMIRSLGMIEIALDEIMVALAEKERLLAGRRASTESLLDAIQDTTNVLSCTPLAHTSLDELEGVDDIQELLLETSTLPSFADSVIFQQENVEKPPEYSKPRVRNRSITFTPPLNNCNTSSLD
jgi:predicted acylesterase/phospholipase RssA